MRGKTFLILLAATGLLLAIWFFRFGADEHAGQVKMGEKLFADLPVNAVRSVTIADAQHRVVLVKGDKVWQVDGRSGYPADFDQLRDMVVKLSRLKIGRSFPASNESLARLSLLAPSTSDTSSTGKQITLTDATGKILADVILGQSRETDSGEGGGQYLKKVDADTVFLVDGSFRFLKTAPAEWLNKEILDVKAEEVKSVACYVGDPRTPIYTLSRPEKGETATLAPVPPGRTAAPAKIDQVLDALAPLTLDDVQAAAGPPPATESGQARLVYQLYDGRQISIFPHSDDQGNFTLRVTAADSTPETPAAAAPDPQPTDEKAQGAATATPAPKTARQLNEALSPWVFSIKKWQFDSFITQPESLLEEVKKKDDGTS
ncbi:MAG: DUF4340 domain-containing protein [Desulfobacteraceae bacterium]|jgi:hypothetical protein|nr:DUF4340 domain-containing protein [Desulfobacteraceae bacterium]